MHVVVSIITPRQRAGTSSRILKRWIETVIINTVTSLELNDLVNVHLARASLL